MFNFFLTFFTAKKALSAPVFQENNGDKKPDSPPELEELFSNLRKKYGKSEHPSNHGSSFHPPANFNKTVAIGILVIGSALWLASGIYTVQERENGVETFLGKYQKSTRAGLNWNWPAPLGKVEKINVTSIFTMRVGELKTQSGRLSTQEQRTGQMLTSDENIVEIGATVQYRISDARRYLFSANQPETVLEDIVISAIREVVGANTVDDILRDRRNEWPEQAKNIMTEILHQYDIGIEIIAFELQDARAPAEVQDAFEDAVRAREDEERARLQAEAFANQRLPEARGEAEQARQSAQAYKAQILAKANADIKRFQALLAAYRVNKDVMRERLYLDTLSQVFTGSKKIIVDSENARPIINLGGTNTQIVAPIESEIKASAPTVKTVEKKSIPHVIIREEVNARSRNR